MPNHTDAPVTICACRERMATAKELVEAQFALRDDALVKQAREYERRLEDLNHNLRMMLDDRKMFYTRDQHDTYAQATQRAVDELKGKTLDDLKDINSRISTLSAEVGNLNTRVVTWLAAGVLGMGALTTLLHIFWR